MVSQPDLGELELLVLANVEPGGSTTSTLIQQVGKPSETLLPAVVRLVEAGYLEAAEGVVTLTETGQSAATSVQRSSPTSGEGRPVTTVDLSEVSRLLSSLWPSNAERAAAEEKARDELLASHADRDNAVHQLSEAFSQGRLSSTELEERTSKALTARTLGELDDVLHGLGGLQRPTRRHPLRKGVFWVLALLFSPFLLLGVMALAFGADVGDRFGGSFFLVFLVPGLLALRRWAWPRG